MYVFLKMSKRSIFCRTFLNNRPHTHKSLFNDNIQSYNQIFNSRFKNVFYTLWLREKGAYTVSQSVGQGLLTICTFCSVLQLWIVPSLHQFIRFVCVSLYSAIPEESVPVAHRPCATRPVCPAVFLDRVWPLVLGEPGLASVRQGFPNSCS